MCVESLAPLLKSTTNCLMVAAKVVVAALRSVGVVVVVVVVKVAGRCQDLDSLAPLMLALAGV